MCKIISSLFYIFSISQLFQSKIVESFIFNKKNRDITNAIITASFSPLFDKWINTVSDTSSLPVETVQVIKMKNSDEESDVGIVLSLKEQSTELLKKQNILLKNEQIKIVDKLSNEKFNKNVPVKNNFEKLEYDQKINGNYINEFSVYEIISAFNNNKEIKVPPNKKTVYYVIENDQPSANNVLFLKMDKKDGAFLITGEILISIILIAILMELQKLTIFQKNR
jgi:hypothetical protein